MLVHSALTNVNKHNFWFYSFSQSLWCISLIILNICKSMCISQNNLYKQHHTIDYLQKPVTYSKSFVHLSKVSIYVNEHISAIRMKVLVSLFTNKTVKMLSHVVSITVHSVSITWCKLWQQFGWQLLYWNAEGCTSYVCHISISKVQMYTLLYVGCWLKETG